MQLLSILLLASDMGADSPPSFLSRVGYAMMWPMMALVGWVQSIVPMQEFTVTLLSYAVGTVIWGAVWFSILALVRRPISRGRPSAA